MATDRQSEQQHEQDAIEQAMALRRPLSVRKIHNYTGIPTALITEAIQRGDIEHVRLGKFPRCTLEAVLAWQRKRTRKGVR